MPKDVFTELGRCTYCGGPAAKAWDTDIVSCGRDVCESLAYAEVRRRRQRVVVRAAPRRRLSLTRRR